MRKIHFSLTLVFLLLLAVFYTACTKERVNTAPVISVTNPADAATLSLADTLHITGNLSDDDGLHTFAVALVYATDTVFTAFPDVHDKESYDFNIPFVAPGAGTYSLWIQVQDHDSTSATLTRTFYVGP